MRTFPCGCKSNCEFLSRFLSGPHDVRVVGFLAGVGVENGGTTSFMVGLEVDFEVDSGTVSLSVSIVMFVQLLHKLTEIFVVLGMV